MSTNMMPYSNSGQLGIFVRPLYSLPSAQHHHHLLHHRCTTPVSVSLTAVLKPQRDSNERGFRSRVVSWSTPQVRSVHFRNVRYARRCSELPRSMFEGLQRLLGIIDHRYGDDHDDAAAAHVSWALQLLWKRQPVDAMVASGVFRDSAEVSLPFVDPIAPWTFGICRRFVPRNERAVVNLPWK